MTDYRYDVAFSFLSSDESTALKINELVSTRAATFIYSERQLEIAGTDGVETFSNTFGRDARTVVVLYRPGWGGTRWTRIEETAIRDRLLNDGAEFVTFVLLEKDARPPKWFPSSRLWTDFDLLGVNGVASVVLERVSSAGCAVREPTPAEFAKGIEQKRRLETERVAFLCSPEGVIAASRAVGELFTALESLSPDAGIAFERCHRELVALYRDHFTVAVGWRCPNGNTLDEATLTVAEWEGRPSLGTTNYAGESRTIRTHVFQFDFVDADDVGWREKKTSRIFSTQKLAEHCAMLLLKRIDNPSAGRRPLPRVFRKDGWHTPFD
jgi:hypothetical protein